VLYPLSYWGSGRAMLAGEVGGDQRRARVRGVERVTVGQLDIAYADDGPPDGRPVVLVHGFPDGWWSFDPLVAHLVDAGYRAIRPALRGYPPTDVPPDRTTALPTLVADLDGLAAALDLADPVLVGHDWGAIIGWASTAASSTPWAAFLALSVPPPRALAGAALDPSQVLRSSYMAVAQVPGVERLLPHLVGRIYRAASPGWEPPAAHVERVAAQFRDPAVGRAALAYYRWLLPAVATRRYPATTRLPDVPVRYLHGEHDLPVSPALVRKAQDVLPPGSARVLPRCGHWPHLERTEEVAEDLLRFLALLGDA
jgi:pimeloyl-ACP methyl ester carboxylesterase